MLRPKVTREDMATYLQITEARYKAIENGIARLKPEQETLIMEILESLEKCQNQLIYHLILNQKTVETFKR